MTLRKKSLLLVQLVCVAIITTVVIGLCYVYYNKHPSTNTMTEKLSVVVPPKESKNLRSSNEVFYVNMTLSTTIGVGSVIVEVHRDWAPIGSSRFEELVNANYFDEAKFFRVIKKFMAQFGIHKDPAVTRQWQSKRILDDPVKQSNTRGTLTFATSGPNTRVNQLYFNFGDNSFLDKQGFSPIGKVIEGMEYIDGLYNGYGEGGKGDGTDGKGPGQGRINNQGNAYLNQLFPKLSYIISARIVSGR